MSFLSDLLFGKEGEPATVVDVTPPEFEALRPEVQQALSQLISSGGGQTFAGPTTAPVTPTEQQFLDFIQGAGTSQTGAVSAAEGLVERTLGGEFLEAGNPFVQSLIDAQSSSAIRNFQRLFPNIQAPFQRAGQQVGPGASSPFERAAGDAKSALLDRLSLNEAQLRSGIFESERGRQTAAVGQAQGLAREDFDRALKGLQAAALPRLVQQFGLNVGLEEFRRRTEVLLRAIAQAGALAAPSPVGLEGAAGTSGIFGDLLKPFATAAAKVAFPAPTTT